jgi:hypothetical protein
MELSGNHVDTTKVSFISKVDSNVRPHINVTTYFFTIVVDGKDMDIESQTRAESEALRNSLVEATKENSQYKPMPPQR